MAKVVCIVQSRMNSQRLPGKSMMLLGGRPLLENVLERIIQAQLVDQVVLATTEKTDDDVLVGISDQLGLECFRGSENDLIDRYYQCAKKYDADIVVRIPADNPLIHSSEIDRIIRYFIDADGKLDFASNICEFLDNKYPDGLGAEVMSFEVLKKLHNELGDCFHREHVTSYIRENQAQFKVGTIVCPEQFQRPDIVLDINTQEQYDFIAKLFEDLSKEGEAINIMDIIPWYDSHIKNLRVMS